MIGLELCNDIPLGGLQPLPARLGLEISIHHFSLHRALCVLYVVCVFMGEMQPHIYVGSDSINRIKSPCFPRADIRASEIRSLEALSKHGLNYSRF